MSDGDSNFSFESDGPVLEAPAPRFGTRLAELAEVYSDLSDAELKKVVLTHPSLFHPLVQNMKFVLIPMIDILQLYSRRQSIHIILHQNRIATSGIYRTMVRIHLSR